MCVIFLYMVRSHQPLTCFIVDYLQTLFRWCCSAHLNMAHKSSIVVNTARPCSKSVIRQKRLNVCFDSFTFMRKSYFNDFAYALCALMEHFSAISLSLHLPPSLFHWIESRLIHFGNIWSASYFCPTKSQVPFNWAKKATSSRNQRVNRHFNVIVSEYLTKWNHCAYLLWNGIKGNSSSLNKFRIHRLLRRKINSKQKLNLFHTE